MVTVEKSIVSRDFSKPLTSRVQTVRLEVTPRLVGDTFSNAMSDTQAATLLEIAKRVSEWESPACWPMQARHICECLTDEECGVIYGVLSTLMEHLEAIPVERRAKAMASQICDAAGALLEDTNR